MALKAGTRLGPYEILAPLGAGGMGEVHRARDTRLGRDVAIKVLRAEVSADAGRLKRFEKEARAASALNHPNIVTIYEIDEVDSVRFIAMERVEGKTLRELLRSGPLPTKRLLDIARQAAAGLARAHEAGIVHRDLKPENIMVTTDGMVKILDFGLAKLTQVVPAADKFSQLPTESQTSPGMLVGTVGYMSPEQASGQAVDVRSDQFSFGSILYEMATGNRPFEKSTAVDTLSTVLHEEPEPISELNPNVPAPLRWTIERCHSKEPSERYDSTGDLARELESLRLHFSEATSSAAIPAPAPAVRPLSRYLLLAMAAVAVLGVGVGLGLALTRWFDAPELPRLQRLTYRYGMAGGARFAPGGKAIVYSASWEGKPFHVYTMNLGSAESRALGVEGMVHDVSPTGELLAGVSRDPFGGAIHELWLASLSGAAPRALAENVRAAVFSPDGSEIALIRALDAPGAGYRLEFPMGEVLYESDEDLFGLPGVSPDGSRVTVAELSDTGTDILVVDRSGRHSTIASFPLASGVFAFSGVAGRNWIMRGSERSGTEILEVTSSGKLRSWLSVPLFVTLGDIAPDGRALFTSYRFRTEMLVFEEGAAGPRSISWSGTSRVADLSADGQTVLFTEETGDREYSVYIREVDGAPAVRLGAGTALSLSPDGLWALAAPDPERDELTLYPTGPGETRTVSVPGVKLVRGRFFPRGDRLLLEGSEAEGTRCYIMPLASGVPQPVGPEDALLPLGGGERAVIAPDGHTVLLRLRDGWWRVAAGGGEDDPVPVEGLEREEWVMGFRDDGKAVFTKREEADAIVIEAVELATARRSLVRRLPLAEGAFSSARLHPARITPDGKTVVYSVLSSTSDVYLGKGLK